MSGTDRDVIKARAEVEAARRRLQDTTQRLKHRVSPATLAANAWSSVRARGESAADQATDTAHRHPVSLSVAGAAAALFLARKPVARLVGRLFRGKPDATDSQQYSLTAGTAVFDPRGPTAPLSGLVQVHEENAQ